MPETMDRSEMAQLADLLELAGSPEAVQAAVLVVESAVRRRPTLAEVVAEILRSKRDGEELDAREELVALR